MLYRVAGIALDATGVAGAGADVVAEDAVAAGIIRALGVGAGL